MTSTQKIRLTKLLDDQIIKNYFAGSIHARQQRAKDTESRLTQNKVSIWDFANGHEYFGLHKKKDHWVLREWTPHASEVYMHGDFSNWNNLPEFAMEKIDIMAGIWELKIPLDKVRHGQLYKLFVKWDGGCGERIPAYVRRVVQDEYTKVFSAQVWAPEKHYVWKVPDFKPAFKFPLIYESHIGMAQEKDGVGTYEEFRVNTLPRIKKAGYNTVQIMALMEHPYYGSFGYHVSNFFAASSRFGTPEELKHLIDDAHELGMAVIMDIIHSHSVKNEIEGLSRFDGTYYQYFHDGSRGEHREWNSRCFNYGRTEVLHFLLSNCRFWLDEYKIDGYRFDGVTSMMYYDHGLGTAFGYYDHYFDSSVDEDAVVYLTLANKVIHAVKPTAITIAEDISGMPGLGAPIADGGIGFDYRLALGIPDFWFNYFRKVSDDHWNVESMFYELTNHRSDEKTISYVECHDQAIVGSKTMAFWLMDASMYEHMNKIDSDLVIDRGVALHKMIRLMTISTAAGGYLNFMGNEFGHPEWIDFPREGNNWSYKYAKRQWSLVDNGFLKFEQLGNFDRDVLKLITENETINQPYEKNYVHCDHKIIVFSKGRLTFIYNFHPTNSVSDYFIDVPKGDYKLLLDSDRKIYGGQERITPEQIFRTSIKKNGKNSRTGITIYLPCRTCMVLKKNPK